MFPCLSLLVFSIFSLSASASDLSAVFHAAATDHVQFVDSGQEIHLVLDQRNASGFQSYDSFLFGYFNMRIKLVPGDSAGTVTTYYFSSEGKDHDELDFEFLGNVSGQPLILQTNVFSAGIGEREQRIFLWFDPTSDFHNYSILWNEYQSVFLVDDIPIRVFPNIEAETGVPYLRNRSMSVYGTIWDGDSWATEGGRVKLNWTHAPFVASYRDFSADACRNSTSATTSSWASDCAESKWWNQLAYRQLTEAQIEKLKWVQSNLTVYNYCTDSARYNVTPPECLRLTPSSVANPNASTPSTPITPTSLPHTFIAAPSPSAHPPAESDSSALLLSSSTFILFVTFLPFVALFSPSQLYC